jgi:spermidine synthase
MKDRVSIAAVVMGFSGLAAEILLLRELLIVFSGNELSIGVILANWLILEAAGCFFPGRLVERAKNKLEAFALITVLFALSLIAAISLTRSLKSIIGVSVGESIGLLPIFYASFLILLPVSVLHGALFTFSCRIYAIFSGQEAAAAGRVYVYETIGAIIGGVACTYLLIPYLHTFQAAFGLAALNFVLGLALLAPRWRAGLLQKAMLVGLSLLLLLSGYLTLAGHVDALHQMAIRAQWRNLDVVHYQNSQYGNICVIENQGQYIFFEDGVADIITPVPDIIAVEEFVHLPLLAHPAPVRVLILSGGAGGVINEALKHPSVRTIEYAELDPLILSLLRKFPTPLTESELNDERVQVVHVDGRLLLSRTPEKYDVIFVGIAEPASLQANRFFTREFFSLARDRLNAGGILVLAAPGSLTLLNEALRDLNSSIFHTLRSVFAHVRVIPGDGRNIFLASDSQGAVAMDKAQIVRRLHERNIIASATVPWHIENKLHGGWQDWFGRFIATGSQKINRDFQPLGLFYSLSYWNALFAPAFGRFFREFERVSLWTVALLLVLILLLNFLLAALRPQTRFRPAGIPFAIAATGFAGMIYDLAVIFAFQSIYGYVFSWIGILVASFMVGAACGATFTTAILPRLRDDLEFFLKLELAIIAFTIGLPFMLLAANVSVGGQGAPAVSIILFLVLSFIGGLLVGSQFPLANKLYLKHSASLSGTAGLLYACDLLGGWLGGMVGAVALLPVLGLIGTCAAVGLLKLASFAIIATQPRLASS